MLFFAFVFLLAYIEFAFSLTALLWLPKRNQRKGHCDATTTLLTITQAMNNKPSTRQYGYFTRQYRSVILLA